MKMKKRLLISLSLIVVIAIVAALALVQVHADDEFKYISDMKPKSVEVGWGELGVNAGLDGAKIKIANSNGGTTTYDKGICAHAASKIVYDLSGNIYSEFVAYIGIHEGSNNSFKEASSVAFEVKVDGVSMYKSSVMRMNTAAQQIRVQLPIGAQTLELITTDGGDGNTGDHSAWADAKLMLGEADPDAVVDVFAVPGSTEVAYGSKTKIDVTQKLFNGTVEAPKASDISFEVSDPSIATVSSNGEVSFKGIGSVTVFVEVTHKNGVIKKEVMLRGYDSSIEGSSWSVTSFSGKNKVTVEHGIYGELTYSVSHGDDVIIEPGSDMGLVSNEKYFADGFKFVSLKEAVIDEKYTNISGKTSEGYNHAKEITIRFEKGEYYFDVIVRAYDDGFAYRYNICFKDAERNGTLTFSGERTSFVLPENATTYSIVVPSLTAVFNHENSYSTIKSQNIGSKYLAFPILYETTNDTWVLLTEAELYGDDYYGSMVKGESGRELRFHQAPRISLGTVTTDANFTSPWRMGIVGGLDTIVESNLVEDVHVRSTEDYSWVKPGVTSWMWLSEGYSGQYNYDKLKEYIDLAYEMGWSYIILDEGWQPPAPAGSNRRYKGYYAWFDNLVKYAEERGVGMIVWIRIEDFDTAEEREIVREWSAKGIKGIKADFFDSEAAEMIEIYNALYDICTEEKMLINCHGANKPTGERQYYANVINREAVMGEEYGGYSTANTTMWAFIRGVVGPMDVTPRMYPTQSSETTVGHQLAMNIVFESGMPCMASSANEYLTTPAYLLLKDLPAGWDETQFIEGFPGTHTVLARRSGSQWYVGGINNTGNKVIKLKLDFLDDGAEYVALTFRDGYGKYDLDTECKTVKKGDTLEFRMVTHTGFAVRLIKKDSTTSIQSIKGDKTSYTVKAGENFKIETTISPANLKFDDLVWTSSDEKVAIVERGSVYGLREGSATIKAQSYFDANVYAEFKVTVTKGNSLNSQLSILDPVITDYGYSVGENGELVLRTITGDINGSYRNVICLDAPDGDFEVTVKVFGRFNDEAQSAGLMLFSESDRSTAIALAKRYYHVNSANGHYYTFYTYKNGSYINKNANAKSIVHYVYLKLSVVNGEAKAYYKVTNEWVEIPGSFDSSLLKAKDLKIGIYSGSGQHGDIVEAKFSDFTVNGIEVPFFGESTPVTFEKVQSSDAPAEAVKVKKGTEIANIGLPTQLTFTLENGETVKLGVTWKCDNYDANAAGEYVFTAEASDIPNNIDESTVSATVKVIVEDEATVPQDDEKTDNPDKDNGISPVIIIVSVVIVVVIVALGVAGLIILKKKKAN